MGRDTSRFRKEIEELILGSVEGALKIGIARAEPMEEEALVQYENWLKQGHHAGMSYLERHIEIRRDPRKLLEGAKSIICIAFPYRHSHERPREWGKISSYALLEDYHEAVREKIRSSRIREIVGEVENEDFRICCDSAPIAERYWGMKSGLGKIGRNGALHVEGYGCEVILAEILTRRDLPTSESAGKGCCDCKRCLAVCPARALQEDGTLDCHHCLSYLTIEHRGAWEDERHIKAMMTDAGRETLYGCDRCITVCPQNKQAAECAFKMHSGAASLRKEDVGEMTQSDFSKLLKGSPIKRVKLEGLRRNATQLMSLQGALLSISSSDS